MSDVIPFPGRKTMPVTASADADAEETLATLAYELGGSNWSKAITLLNGAGEMLRLAWNDSDDIGAPF